jgi:hypothetical protein
VGLQHAQNGDWQKIRFELEASLVYRRRLKDSSNSFGVFNHASRVERVIILAPISQKIESIRLCFFATMRPWGIAKHSSQR